MADNIKFEKKYIDDTGNIPLITVGVSSNGTGGTILPDPAEYSSDTSTIVDGSRNIKGVYVGSVIRNDVAKVSLKWKYLTVQQWANILQCFNTSDNFTTLVRYFDQTKGKYAIAKFYVGDRKAGIFKRDKSGKVMGWFDCSLNIIEV